MFLGGLIHPSDRHPDFRGVQCDRHVCPMGLLGEDAPLGGREMVETGFALASESCLGVRTVQCLCVTQPRRAETRFLKRGRGEPAVTDSAFSCPEPESNCFSWPRVFAKAVPSQDRKLF